MKVGDFVRFSSKIVLENSHLALTGDKGMVVGFNERGTIARVVWSDGDSGEYRVTKLVRTEGTVGSAVRDKKQPLRDKGHKPVSAPERVIANPLPTPKATWAIAEEREIKGFPTKPTPKKPDGGFMRFLTPIMVVEVRACHWPKDSGTIKLSRSDKSLTVTFPNGETQSMTPTGARVWAQGKFGHEMAQTLQNKLRLGA